MMMIILLNWKYKQKVRSLGRIIVTCRVTRAMYCGDGDVVMIFIGEQGLRGCVCGGNAYA